MSPTKLSRHGCIPAEPAAVSPGKIIVPRIVIGGVIFDQPAGGGIGAVGAGPLAGTEVTDAPAQGAKKNALDSARSACGVPRAKHHDRLAWLRSDLIVLLLYRCLVQTKSHKARQKTAGSALSVKLEKYLSRPTTKATSRSLRPFTKDFRKMVLAAPGIRIPRCWFRARFK